MKKITFLAFSLLSMLSWHAHAQFSENFDAGVALPAGWSVINGGGANTWAVAAPGGGTAYSGTNVAKIVYDAVAHDDYLVTPQIAVTAGVNDQLTFWVRTRSASFIEHYEVKLSTAGNTSASDFTVTLLPDTASPITWMQMTLNLSAYVGQSVYIGFHAVSTDQWELYLDDIVNDALPSCVAPTDGMATVTSPSTATLTWTSGGAANAEVVVQMEGTGAPSTANDTGEAATGNTYSATGLSPMTAYEFYVRDECTDGTDLSAWSGPYLFDTTTIPGCSTPITPADGATDVMVGDITFEWTSPTTGDPATSYDMYYGLTADAVNNFVGTFEETTAIITITGYDTTFFWRIVPVNAGGEATGCDGTIWSFTTEMAPTAPINDECAGAIALTPSGDFESGAIMSTNAGATAIGDPVPSCQDDVDASVWYTVVVPASGNVTIETQAADGSNLSDTIIEAYSGTCGSLVAIDCIDDNLDDFFSTLELTGLTGGETIYVAVYRYGSSAGLAGAFQVAAYDASLLANSTFNNSTFVAYPNPVQDVLNLSYNKSIDTINVYNLLGQRVFSQDLNAQQAQVNLAGLPSGNYLAKLSSGSEVQTVKIIKQ